jgi:hypothetical protein
MNPYPERGRGEIFFERSGGSERRFGNAPVYFEEGIARDTDVPNDFAQGAYGDGAPTHPSKAYQSAQTFVKPAAQTMQERAHVGSASWIEAPSLLSEFAEGAGAGFGMPEFVIMNNPGVAMRRQNAAKISDF